MNNILHSKFLRSILTILLIAFTHVSHAIDPTNLFPKVKIVTSMGTMIVELDRVKAPITVDNFLQYVVKGEYNQTIFHRVIEDFVVQGGAYDARFNVKKASKDIINEAGSGLKNRAGTIAMAKESRPHTANRQFFFNVIDNPSLDPGRQWGYAVFGEIVEGEEVLEEISKVPTEYNDTMGWHDVPVKPVTIISATLLPAE